MPKIIRIINRFNLGGPTYNVAYLTKYLPAEYETILVGGQKDDTEESSEFIVRNLGIEPIIIAEMRRSINPLNDLKSFLRIRKLIKEHKPDIVHTHASKAGTLGRLAAITCGVPIIVHTFHGHVFHSYFASWKTAIYKMIERFLASKTNAIIAISEIQKKELTEKFKICNPNKTHVVNLGFDLERFQNGAAEKRKSFREHYLVDDDEIAIAIVGRLVPIKNHKLFLDALSITLKSTDKKVRAFIVGDGEERQNIEAIAASLGIDTVDFLKEKRKATITFTSWIKNVDWVCNGVEIIALTSFNEGTPVSLIEAQAANKPIITTNVGGIENIVLPNETAFLVNNFTPEAFSEKLTELISNDTVRKKMSEKGWDFVKNKFSYHALSSNVDRLYKSLLKQ
ncbi:MAG: glycosyltransferase [Bacteroidetes bacterium]|nr:glycosyltransferase [Bacteroidota bacterium]